MNVGIDLGYSAVKVVAGQRRKTFPSVVGTPASSRFSLGEQEELIVLVAPEHVMVGRGAMTQSRFVNRRERRLVSFQVRGATRPGRRACRQACTRSCGTG